MAPSRMKAIVTIGSGNIELKEVDVPKPGPQEILVKVVAAAQNPTDWKSVKFCPTEGNIVGCDYAGLVEEVGAEVQIGLKVGERVAGLVHGAAYQNGSFAEYAVADPALAVKLPQSWSFEEAAQLGVAGFTTCLALYRAQALPTPLSPATTPLDILVWGASSGVGLYLVQAARQAGLRVIATASPKNFELVKRLGANEVLDYRDEKTLAKIKDLTNGKLKHAVDCISEGETGDKIAEAMGDEGGEVTILLPYESKRKDVKNTFVVGYTVLGKAIEIPLKAPADPDLYKFGIQSAKLLTDLLAAEKLKPIPIKLMPNGLASVKEGFEYMQSGKLSGEKVTYRIADTPK